MSGDLKTYLAIHLHFCFWVLISVFIVFSLMCLFVWLHSVSAKGSCPHLFSKEDFMILPLDFTCTQYICIHYVFTLWCCHLLYVIMFWGCLVGQRSKRKKKTKIVKLLCWLKLPKIANYWDFKGTKRLCNLHVAKRTYLQVNPCKYIFNIINTRTTKYVIVFYLNF